MFEKSIVGKQFPKRFSLFQVSIFMVLIIEYAKNYSLVFGGKFYNSLQTRNVMKLKSVLGIIEGR